MSIVYRSVKGLELTHDEVDENFSYLDKKLTVSTVAPTSSDDVSSKFVVNSRWYNISTYIEYICTDNSLGSAVWTQLLFNHSDLFEIGTNTHTQIDAFINSKNAPNGLASLDIDSLVSMDSLPHSIPSGLAVLDLSGFVPSSQLPSYVDDVLEYADFASLPVTGEVGKIYVTLSDNKTYRWSGSVYTLIMSDLVLGETSATAYRGDNGLLAYNHSLATHAPSNAEQNDANTTLQGNTFNGVSQLVQLDASGNLPAVDGSALTGIEAGGGVAELGSRGVTLARPNKPPIGYFYWDETQSKSFFYDGVYYRNTTDVASDSGKATSFVDQQTLTIGSTTSGRIVAKSDGSEVFAMNENTLFRVSVPTLSTMTKGSSVFVNGFVGLMDIKDDRYVYCVAGNADQISCVDTDLMTVIATYTSGATINAPKAIRVLGNYAFVTCYNGVVSAFDVSNPSVITFLSTLNVGFGGYTYDMDFSPNGNVLFMGNQTTSIASVDISNPSAIALISTYTHADITKAQGLSVCGDYLFLFNNSKFVGIDVSDPSAMVHSTTTASVGVGNFLFMEYFDNIVYVLGGEGSTYHLKAFNVINPLIPVATIDNSIGGSNPSGFWVSEDRMFRATSISETLISSQVN